MLRAYYIDSAYRGSERTKEIPMSPTVKAVLLSAVVAVAILYLANTNVLPAQLTGRAVATK
jgi:hypothetical protein